MAQSSRGRPLWSILFVSQLFLVILLPFHGPGNLTVSVGLLYLLASFPRVLAPESRTLRSLARIAYLAFVVVFGWEIVAPLVHGSGAGYALYALVFLAVFTVPCWLLNWLLPSSETEDKARTNVVG